MRIEPKGYDDVAFKLSDCGNDDPAGDQWGVCPRLPSGGVRGKRAGGRAGFGGALCAAGSGLTLN